MLLLIMIVPSLISLKAQVHWGKADAADFTTRTCAFDSSANAIVLLDSAYTSIEQGNGLGNVTNTYTYSTGGKTVTYTSNGNGSIYAHVDYVIYRRILIYTVREKK